MKRLENILLKENIVTLLGLTIFSIFFVTIIGYFDEGHARIYGSFGNYIDQSGYPPLSDYIVWMTITGIVGILVFNLFSQALKSTSLLLRIVLTILVIPFFIIALTGLFVVGVKIVG